MDEWIRVDDGSGERWHQLARTRTDGRLLTGCGLLATVEAIMDRRPDAPDARRCQDCASPSTSDTRAERVAMRRNENVGS